MAVLYLLKWSVKQNPLPGESVGTLAVSTVMNGKEEKLQLRPLSEQDVRLLRHRDVD